MMKRFLSILFTVLLLVSTVSCTSRPIDDQQSESVAETTEEPFDETYLDKLEPKNYTGKTFTIIGKNDVASAHNFPEETETGEPVNDALFYRNRAVEERYGVNFAYVITGSGGETVSQVEAEVMAGGASFDMVQGSMLTCTNILLTKGLLTKINELPAIDLSQSWWNERCATDLSVNGNFYYITGDIMYEHYMEAACLLFNKTMAEDYGIEDLYALVNDQKWTFEKMLATASAIPSDSGSYRYALTDISGYDFYFGGGMRITNTDKAGIPYLEQSPSEKMIAIADRYASVFSDTSICVNNTYNWKMGTIDQVGRAEDYFRRGEVLYYSTGTGAVAALRDSEVQFGVLPIPKYSETQVDYISYSNPWNGSSVAFPRVLQDAEMAGIITEALAYESRVYLKPAMYDTMLKARSVHDEASAEMLDIVFSTKTFDLCDICEWGGLNYIIRDAILGVSETLASDYATVIQSAKNALSSTIAMFNQ